MTATSRLPHFVATFFIQIILRHFSGCEFNKWRIECWWSNSWSLKYSYNSTTRSWISRRNEVCCIVNWSLTFECMLKMCLFSFFRCCCFFKRKKKKSSRQKWLEAVQCSPEREAVTLLRATSHSNSRDSVLNPSQDYIQASSQHTLRYPSASLLTPTPTNTPTLPL